MLSRMFVEGTKQALWSLGGLWVLGVVIGVLSGAPEAIGFSIAGALAGAACGFVVLGFTSVFNPFCQDRCMLWLSGFFVAAGALLAASYVIWPLFEKVDAGGELSSAVGIAVGVSTAAWWFGNRAAKRTVIPVRTHAA